MELIEFSSPSLTRDITFFLRASLSFLKRSGNFLLRLIHSISAGSRIFNGEGVWFSKLKRSVSGRKKKRDGRNANIRDKSEEDGRTSAAPSRFSIPSGVNQPAA